MVQLCKVAYLKRKVRYLFICSDWCEGALRLRDCHQVSPPVKVTFKAPFMTVISPEAVPAASSG